MAPVVATATPLRRATFGRNSAQLTDLLSVSAAVRLYARSRAAQAEAGGQEQGDGPVAVGGEGGGGVGAGEGGDDQGGGGGQEDGDPADHRDRPGLHLPPAVRGVDQPDPVGQPAGDAGQRQPEPDAGAEGDQPERAEEGLWDHDLFVPGSRGGAADPCGRGSESGTEKRILKL